MAQKLSYRLDVDGLRAVSVTLVILFHMGLAAIPGGFIGVDVFFVISGYLITGIIVREIEYKQFSLTRFYERRIRRIFPALLIVVLFVLATGMILLLPGDYDTTAESALYAVLSSSNFYFLFNTGYFDAAAETMPLLHTWSLAVEEQFYLIWPLLLWALAWIARGRRIVLLMATLGLALASLIYSTWLVQTNPKGAFYWPHTRAWELAAGALVALFPRERWACPPFITHLSGLAGLSLILFSSINLTKEAPFPGLNALYPVVGAVLLIAPWHTLGVVQRVLATAPFVFIGKISYSLYLWHWPVLVLFRHYNLEEPITPIEMTILASTILVLSYLSWRYIEQPARHVSLSPWPTIRLGVTAASATAAIAFGITGTDGFLNRISSRGQDLASLDVMWKWNCPATATIEELGTHCVIGAPWESAPIRGILWGDSHAQHFAPLLDRPAREAGISLVHYSESAPCMPLVGTGALKRFAPQMPAYNDYCSSVRGPFLEFVKNREDVKLVVLAASWSYYPTSLYSQTPSERSFENGMKLMQDGFEQFFQAISRPGLHTLVISDIASREEHSLGCLVALESTVLRRKCPKDMFKIPEVRVHASHSRTNALIRSLPEQFDQVSVVMPQDHLCDQEGCTTTLDGEFLYRDPGHFRRNMTPATRDHLSDLLNLGKALGNATSSQHSKRPGAVH